MVARRLGNYKFSIDCPLVCPCLPFSLYSNDHVQSKHQVILYARLNSFLNIGEICPEHIQSPLGQWKEEVALGFLPLSQHEFPSHN